MGYSPHRSGVFFIPNPFHLHNEERVLFVLHVRPYHLLLAVRADELSANMNAFGSRLFANDTGAGHRQLFGLQRTHGQLTFPFLLPVLPFIQISKLFFRNFAIIENRQGVKAL